MPELQNSYFWESQDVALSALVYLVNLYTLLDEVQGVDHQGYPVEEGLLAFRHVLVLVQDVVVHLLFVRLRDNVPGLGGPFVIVVEGVHVKVLDVPTERGELHPHVDPGLGYPADIRLSGLANLQQGGRILEGII